MSTYTAKDIEVLEGLEPVRRQVAEIIEIMRDPARRPQRRDSSTA